MIGNKNFNYNNCTSSSDEDRSLFGKTFHNYLIFSVIMVRIFIWQDCICEYFSFSFFFSHSIYLLKNIIFL